MGGFNKTQDGPGAAKIPATPEEQNQIRRAHKARQKADRVARRGTLGGDTIRVGMTLVQRKELAEENVRLKSILAFCAEDRKDAIQRVVDKNTRKLQRS